MIPFFKKKKSLANQKEEPSLQSLYPDIVENEFWKIYELCSLYTMTSLERMYALYKAVYYILENDIEGDFIECGVWKGGCAMLMAKLLEIHNIKNRKIILYDTYEGMSEPTEKDKDFSGKTAAELLQASSIEDQASVWCYSSFEEVKNNINLTGFDVERFHMIKGKVEDTIPANLPTSKIALLRLDTDWYESTLHELVHLYPLLNHHGILIIDDYGHWEGCRRAVTEYIKDNNINLLLNRIDNTGRIAIKI